MALSVTHSKTLIAPDSGSDDKVYGADYVSASSHTVAGTLAATSVTGLATIATSGVITDATGTLAALHGGTGLDGSAAANGKVLIGNGSGFTLANIASGSGISITNSAGGVSIACTVAPISDVIFAAAPNSDFDLTNGGAGGLVTIFSKSILGISAGDSIVVDIWSTILNNSAAVRTYSHSASFAGMTIASAENGTIAANATNRASRRTTFHCSVSATNLANMQMSQLSGLGIGAGALSSAATAVSVVGFNTTTSDLTGTQTFSWAMSSNSTLSTQTLTLHSYTIRKVATI